MFKSIAFALAISCAGASFAQRTPVDMESGDTPMQISLQKELYGILISDTDEVQADYKAKGIFYQNDALGVYRSMLDKICERDAVDVCPPVYFTQRVKQGIASMYPNGVLAINESMAARIEDSEAQFLLAHEYAHYKFNHSRQRMKVVSQSVVNNGYMVREPEQALEYAGFFKGVKEAHYDYENQADAYGFAYIAANGIAIDCEAMFLKIADGAEISTDKHDSVAKRCAHYKP